MKHFNELPGRMRGSPKVREAGWGRWLLLLSVWMLTSIATQVSAQCTLACNGTALSPLQVAINQVCEVKLIPDVILEAPQICPGPKNMVVRRLNNALVAQGVDSLVFDASALVGEVLSVNVRDVATNISCTGYIRVVDNLAPDLNCSTLTVHCFVDTDPDVIGYPIVTENCDNDVAMVYSDTLIEDTCFATYAALILRSWTASDNAGNIRTCVQQIRLQRPSLDSIKWPRDTLISCTYPIASPDSLGRPLIDSTVVKNGLICDWFVTHDDDTLNICGLESYEILRKWRVTDICTGLFREDTQIIRVRDQQAPQVICPPPMTINAITGTCYATVVLPLPQFTDNCDASPGISITTSYGAQGMGPHPLVPVGQHTVTYTIVDHCGNTGFCTMTVNIVDNQAPVAICDDQVVVALPNIGNASVPASTFDEGSHDNCPKPVYFKAKRTDTLGACGNANGDDAPNVSGYQEYFDDNVFFCCEDVTGSLVPVTFKVYEVNPGPGPVNPNRELPGGDLFGKFSECFLTVRVQDTHKPIFSQQPASTITVNCTSNLDNHGPWGMPVVSDNCSFTLDSTIVTNLNDCSVGTITRTLTATDASGNARSWVQTINVVNNQVITANQIVWPQNYTTNLCGGGNLLPENLPAVNGYPVFPESDCGVINYNFTDQVFNIAQPACFKIIRTWTVIDWCHYNPSDPSAGGRFTYQQTIKVEDHQAPVINCQPSVTINANGNCTGAQVTLPPITATDCYPNPTITNNSPHATATGANISGFYPMGATTVTVTATDNCGNSSTCQMTINVVDNTPPAVMCIAGLSTSIAITNGQPQAVVQAAAFDAGSSDNCTATGNLVRTVRKAGTNLIDPPTTTQIVFTCEDIGNQLIEFWVTDAAGNSDYCVTYIAVQDNSLICNPATPASGMIAGGIQTEDGSEVENVAIQVMGPNPLQMTTGIDGHYQFPQVPFGNDYTVVPQRNDDPLNGVTTLDLVLMTKHILGTQPLNTPYKIIAADIDRSGAVTTSDVIKLRRLVLNMDSQLPNGTRSWRFVPADFQFPDPSNPFAGYFPEIMSLADLNSNEMEADFIAIKVGDVNCSAVPTSLNGDLEEREDNGSFTLIADNDGAKAGEEFTVDFYGHGMDYIPGYQFTLDFDVEKLEYIEVENGALEGMSDANFGLTALENGQITTSWNETTPHSGSEKVKLFSIKFRAIEDTEIQNALQINNNGSTRAEAYTRTHDVLGVNLMFADAGSAGGSQTAQGYELYQNRPNPFSDETIIAFQMPERGTARLMVFDAGGRLIFQNENTYDEGYNEVTIGKAELPRAGVLYYTLESGAWKDTKKMIMLE